MEFSQKEKLVREKCDLSKVKVRPDDGRIYLIVKRKTISSINYPGLIDKLYDHFYGIQNCTLDNFFEIWMKWRDEETSTSKKTIKENRFLWNALLKDREITKMLSGKLNDAPSGRLFRADFRTLQMCQSL